MSETNQTLVDPVADSLRKAETEHKKWIEAENMKATLQCIRTLVTDALAGERPDFLKAKRLCEVADHLRRALGTKVADFGGMQLPGEVQYVCDVDEAAGGVGGMRLQGARLGGGMEDLTRTLVGTLDRQQNRQSTVDTARAHEIAALELETLLKLEPMTQGEQQARIQKRIDVITKSMEAADGLVHPDVLGRHQAHREGEGQDAGAADGDDGRGALGAPPVAAQRIAPA